MTIEQLELLPLKVARARPQEPIKREAEIDGFFRWTLRRAWGAGPPVGWVCLNPSVASAETDDPTCWEMMCHSLRLGFGSMVVTNIYAYRATYPRTLKRWIGGNRHYCPPMTFENGQRAGVALKDVGKIICGWGNHARQIDIDAFLENIASVIIEDTAILINSKDYPVPLYCLGTTESGAPKHPLARGKHRIAADQPLLPWKMPT